MRTRRVLFLGSKQIGLRIVQEMHRLVPTALVGAVTIDDHDDTRTQFAAIREFCNTSGIQFSVVSNRADTDRAINHARPDLVVVAGWYWIIGEQMLESVPMGFVGIHNSLLPKYRGGAPLVWAMIAGESQVGVSIFQFTAAMDAGPIWAQDSITLGDDEYISSALSRLSDVGVELFADTFPKMLSGETLPVAQDHLQATYCAQRLPSDGMIDWTAPAAAVYNFIRAQSDPYPGAYTLSSAGKRLTVWKARWFEFPYYGTPGQVLSVDPSGVRVACGDNRALELTEMGDEHGKKPANQFITSINERLVAR